MTYIDSLIFCVLITTFIEGIAYNYSDWINCRGTSSIVLQLYMCSCYKAMWPLHYSVIDKQGENSDTKNILLTYICLATFFHVMWCVQVQYSTLSHVNKITVRKIRN